MFFVYCMYYNRNTVKRTKKICLFIKVLWKIMQLCLYTKEMLVIARSNCNILCNVSFILLSHDRINRDNRFFILLCKVIKDLIMICVLFLLVITRFD